MGQTIKRGYETDQRWSGRVATGRVLACVVSLLFAALASPADTLAQDRAETILEDAAARYSAVETLCADFTQHLEVPLLGSERTGKGYLCQGRPNLFAMRFTDPDGDAIVVDGSFSWVYFPSNDPRTVLKTSAENSAGGRDFHREFLVDPTSKYDVAYEDTETVAGHDTYRLRLLPKRPATYRAAVLWIDQGSPVLRRLRLEEENGNIRTITLEGVDFDAKPDDSWFRFTVPDGALVVVR